MIFDDTLAKVVLFGGSHAGSATDETWTWNGTNWTQESPASSVGARDSHGMANDFHRSEIVLFGGANQTSPFVYSETWIYSEAVAPTATPTSTSTATSTATFTSTATSTATSTSTATATATATVTRTFTPVLTSTATSTHTAASTSAPTIAVPTPRRPTPTRTPNSCTERISSKSSAKKTITIQPQIVSESGVVSGKATSRNLALVLASLRIPCNFTPDLPNTAANENTTAIAISRADENGIFRFTVEEGDYEVSLSGSEVELVPSSISVSTDNPTVVQEFEAVPVDLNDEGCERTEAIEDIEKFSKAASAQAAYGTTLYTKYSKAVKKLDDGTKAATALEKIAQKIAFARDRAINYSTSFPTLKLECNGKATCTTKSYASALSKTVAGVKAIQKQTNALAKKANSYLGNLPLTTVSSRALKLYQTAIEKGQKLPAESDVCTE